MSLEVCTSLLQSLYLFIYLGTETHDFEIGCCRHTYHTHPINHATYKHASLSFIQTRLYTLDQILLPFLANLSLRSAQIRLTHTHTSQWETTHSAICSNFYSPTHKSDGNRHISHHARLCCSLEELEFATWWQYTRRNSDPWTCYRTTTRTLSGKSSASNIQFSHAEAATAELGGVVTKHGRLKWKSGWMHSPLQVKLAGITRPHCSGSDIAYLSLIDGLFS